MRYHNITKDDMLNGEGLRVVLWVAGCSHNCPECHNPVTWDIRGGIPFDQAAKDELFEELQKDYVSGVTLSGGDPLHPDNREETGRLIDEICDRFPGKTIWLYTGYDWEGSAVCRVSARWTWWWTASSWQGSRTTASSGRAVPTSGLSMCRGLF